MMVIPRPEQDETSQLTHMLPHGSGVTRIIEPAGIHAAIYARTQAEQDACLAYCKQKGYTLKEEHCYQGETTLVESSALHPFRRAAYRHESNVFVVFEKPCISTHHRYLSAFKTVMQVNHIRIEHVKDREPGRAIQEPSFD
jgi:hypothetical protein